MKTRIIGDIHGKFKAYNREALWRVDGPSIQLGDFGVGFGYPSWDDTVALWQKRNPQHRFIRGNHDNPSVCKEMPGYIPDGTVENDMMFIGGAWSIDWPNRLPGVDWWPDEELSYTELDRLHDVYSIARPRIMITHDAPTDVTYQMFVQTGLAIGGSSAKKIQTRTGQAFQSMFEIYQPDLFIFGHWHHTRYAEFGNTVFLCLGELEYIDLDLSSEIGILEAKNNIRKNIKHYSK